MYGLRKSLEAREEASEVQARHGSRKSGLPQTGQRKRSARAARDARQAPTLQTSPQGNLFE
jgi:deoxyribodipyrimidine photo-lyase